MIRTEGEEGTAVLSHHDLHASPIPWLAVWALLHPLPKPAAPSAVGLGPVRLSCSLYCRTIIANATHWDGFKAS